MKGNAFDTTSFRLKDGTLEKCDVLFHKSVAVSQRKRIIDFRSEWQGKGA